MATILIQNKDIKRSLEVDVPVGHILGCAFLPDNLTSPNSYYHKQAHRRSRKRHLHTPRIIQPLTHTLNFTATILLIRLSFTYALKFAVAHIARRNIQSRTHISIISYHPYLMTTSIQFRCSKSLKWSIQNSVKNKDDFWIKTPYYAQPHHPMSISPTSTKSMKTWAITTAQVGDRCKIHHTD